MSDLKVEVLRINRIQPLPDSDNLVQVRVKGWEVICRKEEDYKVNELVVYFPVESIIPYSWSDKFGITKYLRKLPQHHLKYNTAGRLIAAKLRGTPSFGFIVRPDREWQENQELTDYYGVEKFEPDPVLITEETEKDNCLFHKYCDIQNIKNHLKVFEEGEIIAITEKGHGTQSGVGYVVENGLKTFMARSHYQRKKHPSDCNNIVSKDKGLYWMPLEDERYAEEVKRLLTAEIFKDSVSVILWGELIGLQDLKYGCDSVNRLIYRAFDISVDGKYLDYDEFKALTLAYDIPTVPCLYYGPWSLDLINKYTSGKTLIGGNTEQIREGVVIKSVKESKSEHLRNYNSGRKILKSISNEYTFRKTKNPTENH